MKFDFELPHEWAVEKWESQPIPEEFRVLFPDLTSPNRLAEFFAGRNLIRETFKKMGVKDPGWIGRTHAGLPQWPPGYGGSLSHSKNWLALGITSDEHSLGIDLQIWFNEDQAKKICRRIQQTTDIKIEIIPGQALPEKMTLLFCIFEAIQKCLGNRGIPPIPVGLIEWGEVKSNSWTMTAQSGSEKLKISGFWAGKEDFCIAFGCL